MKQKILCIIGRSGSGKTTIEKLLCRYFPNQFRRVVSHTTRQLRPGEHQGDEHIFVTPDDEPPRLEMVAYTRYGNADYWTEPQDFADDMLNTYVIDVDGYRMLRDRFQDRYDIRVLYIRRDILDIPADRLDRDDGRMTLEAEEVDALYYNNAPDINHLVNDLPTIRRAVCRAFFKVS